MKARMFGEIEITNGTSHTLEGLKEQERQKRINYHTDKLTDTICKNIRGFIKSKKPAKTDSEGQYYHVESAITANINDLILMVYDIYSFYDKHAFDRFIEKKQNRHTVNKDVIHIEIPLLATDITEETMDNISEAAREYYNIFT